MSEPKVTACFVNVDEDGSPCVTFMDIYTIPHKGSEVAALIIFKEDYDALLQSLKHREELYWKLTAEFDEMKKELEELRKWKDVATEVMEAHDDTK